MNILAINPGHNGSAAFIMDGEIKFYIEEERLSRQKYDGNPFRGIEEALQYQIDFIVIGGTSSDLPKLPWTGQDPYSALVLKHQPGAKVINVGDYHHIGHAAAAFYNSGFEDAVAVIVDGSGSMKLQPVNQEGHGPRGFETESIFDCSYPASFKPLYKSFGGNYDMIPGAISGKSTTEEYEYSYDNAVTLVKAYEAVSEFLGFGYIEAGKTMGLAPYGKDNPDIPKIFVDGFRADRNFMVPNYPAGAHVDVEKIPFIKDDVSTLSGAPTLWHTDPSKVLDSHKDLAWRVQNETQELVGDLIEKATQMTGKTNVVIAGGYGLNCVANYYLQKRFPDLNIWVDPVSHDGGTSIGLAKMLWHGQNKDETIRPLKSLYLGIDREENYDNLKYIPELGGELTDVSTADVAKLIADRNIVTIFQGRSEAGPRALGNRSILYDPTDPNGKDFVNKVKGREWFRPFAGSMLHEYFEEWFETHGLEETPYMMYAMDFKPEKHGEVPSITHVDGTCRIQTVKEEQNPKYYELISEFHKITGVPILFNTSFNLAGEPLVETLEDAIRTIQYSDIEYLYLPEVGKLVKYTDNLSVMPEEENAEDTEAAA